MRLGKILVASLLVFSSIFASEFINYDAFSKKLKEEAKQSGMMASTQEVKDALNAKDWAVVDVRTMEEWSGAAIKGSFRVGREAPEKALENIVLDDDNKFIKNNLIVVCNTASRAAIEAQAFKQMGFKTVKIYDGMKAKNAAEIFDQMINEGKIEDVFDIILRLRESNVTQILKFLTVTNASRLTQKLEKYNLDKDKKD